jgi:hypothetical protein
MAVIKRSTSTVGSRSEVTGRDRFTTRKLESFVQSQGHIGLVGIFDLSTGGNLFQERENRSGVKEFVAEFYLDFLGYEV